MRTPNHTLVVDHTYQDRHKSFQELPAGSIVKVIEYCYVPKHVREDERFKHYNSDEHSFCYTNKGFLLIPKYRLREI